MSSVLFGKVFIHDSLSSVLLWSHFLSLRLSLLVIKWLNHLKYHIPLWWFLILVLWWCWDKTLFPLDRYSISSVTFLSSLLSALPIWLCHLYMPPSCFILLPACCNGIVVSVDTLLWKLHVISTLYVFTGVRLLSSGQVLSSVTGGDVLHAYATAS